MKKILVCLLVICLAFPVLTVSAEPACSAAGAVVINGITGEILWSKNPEEPHSMASTTKLMTALLLAESGDLDETVTVAEEAAETEGSSAGLVAGQTVTKRFLLAGMMLASGNDAATQTALTMDGSLEKFAERMNRRAAAIGMKNTHFVTPSGLDAEGHYATAYDMALLAAEVLGNKELRDMAASVTYRTEITAPKKEVSFTNHNKLLTTYEGCVGLKTGYTKKSGRCLVSAARREGKLVIAVTLNDADDWADHQKLLDYGFSEIDTCDVSYRPPDRSLPIVGGEVPLVSLAVPTRLVGIRAEQAGEISTEVEIEPFLYAPVAAGQKIGKVSYYYKGRFVASDPLFCGGDVAARQTEDESHTFWRNLRLLFYLYQ